MYPKLEETLKKYQELEAQMADPDIMTDGLRYSKIAKEHGTLAKQVKPYQKLKQLVAEVEALTADAARETDADMKQMIEDEIKVKTTEREELQAKIEDMLLVDPGEDFDSIIVEVRAGTGGDEASLFASDLFNMYTRYAGLKGWKVETLDFSPTDAGGFKEISFNVSGEGCYRFLRYESGGHRVQRVPKTETQGRIHTSAATVAVLPEPTEVQIDIRPEDIETQTFSCGGPGGQHVNKTQSGVRLIHKPTGVVAESRQERSQHKNKDICWRMIRTRIYEAQQEKVNKERAALRKGQIGTGDRNDRIRTYNFPQNRVTDHRINYTMHSLDKMMMGEMYDLVRALMDEDKKEQLAQLAGKPA
ncbi:MAG: peptide chain release factor 1 [Planctomycetia bacterium]|nr:peptide chain release factor 1 [Planctomycetia bacterium]